MAGNPNRNLKLKGSTWFLKLDVPKDLQPVFGKTAIMPALSKDLQVARNKRDQLVGHYKQEFAAIREARQKSHDVALPPLVSEEDLVRVARAFMEEEFQAAVRWLQDNATKPFEDLEWAVDVILTEYRDDLHGRTYSDRLTEETSSVVSSRNMPVPRGSSDWGKLRSKLCRAKIQSWTVALTRAFPERDGKTEYWDDLTDLLSTPTASQRPQSGPLVSLRPSGGPTFKEVYKAWVKEKSPSWSPTTKGDYAIGSELFLKLCGDLPIRDIRRDHGRRLRDTALKLPNDWRKNPELRDRSPEDLSQDETLDGPKLSPKTVTRYLQAIKGALNFALEEGDLDSNVLVGVTVPKQNGALTTRDVWDEEVQKKWFSSALYKAPRKSWTHKQWLPLLGLYTGARQEELAKLRLEDVKRVGDHWVLDIVWPSEEERLKNLSSERHIPISSRLIAAGFLEYVERVRETGAERLWPELNQSAKGKWGPNFSKWFTRARRKVDPDWRAGVDCHSFRHTVMTALANDGVPDEHIKSIVGHSQLKSAGTIAIYRRDYQVPLKAGVIERLSFPVVERLLGH